MWGPCVDYSRRAVGHLCAMWQTYLFRCICQYSWSHYWLQLVHMRYLYWNSSLISANEVIDIWYMYGFWGAYLFWHIYDYSMEIKLYFFAYMCSNVGLYVYCFINSVKYTCLMWQAYLFRAYLKNMNLSILVLVVTMLIAVSLYEVYILT